MSARPRSLFLLIALISLGALAFGVLYLQNIVGLNPCPMCIVQRYALIGVGVCCLLAASCRRRGRRAGWGVLAIALAGFGAFTAARQSWLQWHPPAIASCGRDFYSTIESFPLQRAIPMIFRGAGDCSAVDWTFLGGSIANWSFIWFALAIVSILALLLNSRRSFFS
ncbi:MAG: disulfide bond formation protein B [Burkholderiaceae bacterium]|nr:disulfide bond formation protein B [Burkholderiaceae bacterium]